MPHDVIGGLSAIRARAARAALQSALQREGPRARLPMNFWPKWQREAYRRNKLAWKFGYTDRLRHAVNVVTADYEPDGS